MQYKMCECCGKRISVKEDELVNLCANCAEFPDVVAMLNMIGHIPKEETEGSLSDRKDLRIAA